MDYKTKQSKGDFKHKNALHEIGRHTGLSSRLANTVARLTYRALEIGF